MPSWINNSTGEPFSSRKKWNLENRQSLHNLKHQFAKDGCPDTQYDVALQILESNESDSSITDAQGVYWLLSAANQGHEEALEKLRDCYEKRRGITDYNETDVRSCLEMPSSERATRKAAKELFSCLANGRGHITPKQLERKMREIYHLQKKRRSYSSIEDESDSGEQESSSSGTPRGQNTNLDVSASEENNSYLDNVITEANLVAAAVNYSRGRLPNVHEIAISMPHPNSLDHVPCFHRILFHPLLFFTLLYNRMINFVSSFPEEKTLTNLKLFLILIIYAFFSNDGHFTNTFLPIFLFYATLSTMIWSTFKMLKAKHEFIDFRIWSGLFLNYGDHNIDPGRSENLFVRNNMRPYLYFFCGLTINLVVYPVVPKEWLLFSEITIISSVLTFTTIIAFMWSSPTPFPDFLVLTSFGVNVLAKYPYEQDEVVTSGWRFLDLKVPGFSSFVIGNGIEFCLNCRTLFYLMIPGFLAQLAKRQNWHGIYKHLIPHCVTLSWLQISLNASQEATMFGLVRGALGLSGFLLFLPLFGIATLMIPIILLIDWLGFTDTKTQFATTVLAAGIALIVSCFMALNRTTQKYITFLQVVLCIVAGSLLTIPYMTSNMTPISKTTSNELFGREIMSSPSIPSDYPSLLTWEMYYNYCGSPAWETNRQNKINTQLRCSHLENYFITWNGVISGVRISSVSNYRATFIKDYLPEWISNSITCFFGESNYSETCTSGKPSELCLDIYKLLKYEKKCNLNEWNSYKFEIKVRMHSGILSKPADVFLNADHVFKNFTESLRSGDKVTFTGYLQNTRTDSDSNKFSFVLGGGLPSVNLESITCILCDNKDLTSVHSRKRNQLLVHARMKDLMRGVKYLLNVLFNPLIIFK